MVTPDTVVVGVEPDISAESFDRRLRDGGSPAAGSRGYLDVVHHRVSPAFALAIFHHESQFGRIGLVPEYDLKNPGATRTSRTGEGGPVQIPGRGQFWRYPSWTAGWNDLAFRLVDPTYVYAREGRTTIKEIIERWAPSSDGNVPSSYINAVVRDMTAWIEEPPMKPQIEIPSVEIEWVAADDRHYTKGRTHPVKQIVHHHTDGWNSLDWLTVSKNSNVSAHFLVNHEGTKIWQLVRLEDTAHTQMSHNPWSVGIEWERKWPDQTEVPEKVYETLRKLDAEIIRYVYNQRLGIIHPTREFIKRHDEVNDTSCPMNLDVERIVHGGGKPPIHFPTGYSLKDGFADFWRHLGERAWAAVGYPLTDELTEIHNGEGLVTVQRTDVGFLQYNPENGEVRMATEKQRKAIEKDLGISQEINITRERLHLIGEELVDLGEELTKA